MARALAKDHHGKRQQILTYAAHVFAVEGFDRASMASVALAAGISKANIYHYYPSKDELLFGILDNHLSALREEILFLDIDSTDPEQRFRTTIEAIMLAYHGADNEHQLQINALSQLPEEKQAVLKAYQSDLVRHMSLLISAVAPRFRGKDKNKLHPTTMSVFGMLNWYYLWNSNASKQARIDYAKLVCDLTLNGLHKAN